MSAREATFFSDGLRLKALVQTPDAEAEGTRFPAILICSGRMGLKEWIPPRWAPFLMAAGFACMAFDYRNLGSSEGERGRLLPEEEVRDVMHALTFLQQQPDIDAGRIALAGFGLGGGVAVVAAARDDRVCAVACVNGVGDSGRVSRQSVSEEAWRERQRLLAEDRVRRVMKGRSDDVHYTDVMRPGQAAAAPFDFRAELEKAVGKAGGEEGGLGNGLPDRFTLESVEALYAFRPEAEIGDISPRPVLVVHTEHNDYHPPSEGASLFEHAREPKTFHQISGAGHLDWTDPQHPRHGPVLSTIAGWFADHVAAKRPGEPG